jgi:hypothetical protein
MGIFPGSRYSNLYAVKSTVGGVLLVIAGCGDGVAGGNEGIAVGATVGV